MAGRPLPLAVQEGSDPGRLDVVEGKEDAVRQHGKTPGPWGKGNNAHGAALTGLRIHRRQRILALTQPEFPPPPPAASFPRLVLDKFMTKKLAFGVLLLLLLSRKATAQYEGWHHAGSMWILTTPNGAGSACHRSGRKLPVVGAADSS